MFGLAFVEAALGFGEMDMAGTMAPLYHFFSQSRACSLALSQFLCRSCLKRECAHTDLQCAFLRRIPSHICLQATSSNTMFSRFDLIVFVFEKHL